MALRQCKRPPNLDAWPSDLVGEEGKQPPKLPFRRGIVNKGIVLTIKRPQPVTNPLFCPLPITPMPKVIPNYTRKRKLPVLSNYFSNLQELLELEECGEPVSWPDGLSAIEAKKMIRQHISERESSLTEEEPAQTIEVDLGRQVGGPSRPAIHTKVASYTAAKPPLVLVRSNRRFGLPSKSSSSTECPFGPQASSVAALQDMKHLPETQELAKPSVLDDPDMHMSESDSEE